MPTYESTNTYTPRSCMRVINYKNLHAKKDAVSHRVLTCFGIFLRGTIFDLKEDELRKSTHAKCKTDRQESTMHIYAFKRVHRAGKSTSDIPKSRVFCW